MPITVKFELEKTVKHSVRYKEVVEQGRAPLLGSLYVQKWYAGDAKELTVTIAKPDDSDS